MVEMSVDNGNEKHSIECHCQEILDDDGHIKNNIAENYTEEQLYDLAELFKVFGDSTRIRILFALFEQEVCVCELADSLGMTQSAISHQLRVLRQSRLVRCRRSGKTMLYALADDHVRTILEMGMDHIME